ncbi:hypothetical protein HDU81_008278 [Chytriomyces hyalinus]|nr:hypothetical protein HDU81_008278 [Chytriomyces hyalinus]
MAKLILACFLLLQICQLALGQKTLECSDNSTSPATPLAIKSTYLSNTMIYDLKVIKTKNYVLESSGTFVDVDANKALLSLEARDCAPSGIIPRPTDDAIGAIFVVKKPTSKPAEFRISPNTITVVVKKVNYGGGLTLTDNDQTLLVVTQPSKTIKYTIKNCKVTLKAPTMFANLTKFSSETSFAENVLFANASIVIGKNGVVILSRGPQILVLSWDGKKLLRTISSRPFGAVTSLVAFKDGSLNVVFVNFFTEESFVLEFDHSGFSDGRVMQDISCKLKELVPVGRREE